MTQPYRSDQRPLDGPATPTSIEVLVDGANARDDLAAEYTWKSGQSHWTTPSAVGRLWLVRRPSRDAAGIFTVLSGLAVVFLGPQVSGDPGAMMAAVGALVLFAYPLLVLWLDRVRVTVDAGRLTVRRRPLPWGGYSMLVREVAEVRLREWKVKQRGGAKRWEAAVEVRHEGGRYRPIVTSVSPQSAWAVRDLLQEALRLAGGAARQTGPSQASG